MSKPALDALFIVLLALMVALTFVAVYGTLVDHRSIAAAALRVACGCPS